MSRSEHVEQLRISLNNQSLENCLLEAGVERSIVENIYRELLKLGYNDEELSNVYKQFVLHGRLFLHNLLRLCDSETIQKLALLSAAVEKLETTLSTPAHFIWVGPPTQNKSELLGIRSLVEAKGGQRICFWVLDEHIAAYKKLMDELKLVTVEVISIESYAKKMQYRINQQEAMSDEETDLDDLAETPIEGGDSDNDNLYESRYVSQENIGKTKEVIHDETLIDRIEYFKALAKKKEENAAKILDPNERKLKMTDVIRDRVTIVDHVKSLIPLYAGGFVFDVDVTFPLPYDATRKETLPDLVKWTFPLIAGDPDVWFFYCNRTLTGNGLEETYPEDSLLDPDAKRNRNFYLSHYSQAAVKLYDKRGDKPLTSDFVGKLGNAICGIANESQSESENQLNDYIIPQKNIDSDAQTQAVARLDRFNNGRIYDLLLPNGIRMVKYYNQSYMPQHASGSLAASPPIQMRLLYIKDAAVFDMTLSQRCRFTDFDVTMPFNARVEKSTRQGEIRCYELCGLTMMHLALIARPELFLSILNQVSIEKVSELLSGKIDIPKAILDTQDDEQVEVESESHTLLSLVQKLNSKAPSKQLDAALVKIQEVQTAAKKFDSEIAQRILKEMTSISAIEITIGENPHQFIQQIVDAINNKKACPSLFSSSGEAWAQAVINLGAKKSGLGAGEQYTVQAVKNAVAAKIKQEKLDETSQASSSKTL